MFRQKHTLITFSTFFLLLLLVPSTASLASTESSPLTTIKIVQESIDASDYTAFAKVVDVDAVVSSAIPKIILQLQALDSTGMIQTSPALSFAFKSINPNDPTQLAFLSQLVGSEVKTLLASGISGGYFAGQPNGKGTGAHSSILDKMTTGRKAILGKKVRFSEPNKAIVEGSLHDEGNAEFPLVLGLELQENLWRVVSIENAEELVNSAIAP